MKKLYKIFNFFVLAALFLASVSLFQEAARLRAGDLTSASASVPATAVQTAYNTTMAPTSNTSSNWAGYVATSGRYTGVSGTWVVPSVNASANSSISADATWIGIGGVNTNDLIQTGTQAISDSNGRIVYEAWFEKLPQSVRAVPLAVKPGDSVSASITQAGNDLWKISLTNNTTGKNFSITTPYASSLSSAEWIEEMPAVNFTYSFVPLDQFGAVNFTSASAVQDGQTVTPTQAKAEPVNMINRFGQELATTSTLNSDGAGFTVARTDASTLPTIYRRRAYSFTTAPSSPSSSGSTTYYVRPGNSGRSAFFTITFNGF